MGKACKDLLILLGFKPKNGAVGIYEKKYVQHGYSIEINFEKKQICYGTLINSDCKTTQNFSQEENWVVLECVDRLLEKGYNPENIILEKVYPSGHGHSGRLDILVTKNSKAFLMIECKTWGKEFENELNNTQKNGGQLLTYFQNDKDAEYLMLYASRLNVNKIEYQNEIIKIEEYYRQAGNVVDTFERWNKQTYSNGIFDAWVNPYGYKNKPLTKADLLELTEENSGKIFHGFLSILRKHSVSDKPNAFNKIFNLFLAKIYDEKKRDNDTLDFQWLEEVDNPVDFQVRLYNLHKAGLFEFLKKEIEGISDSDFKYDTEEELLEKKKKLLKFNKVFDIKDVIDDESFDDNFKVLKEVVQLLEKYQIRYPRKQQHLSDFFERLLTTGLKQEVGQFFTPPPITKFIAKSLPLDKMLEDSINQPVPKLPAVIDYAAGSGHFITEILEAYQDCINEIDTTNFYPEATKTVEKWKIDPYSWAGKYVYGIEKDYRLVKVAKVGCYFYGDGLAQVIHGDGLDSFKYSKSYVGLLSENTKIEDSQKAKFSIVVSNPPYSVDAFKGDIKNINVSEEFELYKYLTDRSSEIECLFVERTKQLLKDDGVAGIVLPSSILTNSGIYTKTREILLKYFDIIAITELGSNTFMATGTNTVVLFLRRKNNKVCEQVFDSIAKFFENRIDATINNIETPVKKYVDYVWEGLSFNDYLSLLDKTPNDKVKKHDLFKNYKQNITAKTDNEFWNKLIELEKEKIYYYILACKQELVIVKTGEKEAEKQFLGYEFSNRRGSEGMHAIQRGKSIDECTKLFDTKSFNNPLKASTYIYKAFENDFDFAIDETLKDNISRINLLDLMTFDRADFEKVINVKAKKKVKIDTKYPLVTLEAVCKAIFAGGDVPKDNWSKTPSKKYYVPIYSNGTAENALYGYTNIEKVKEDAISISARGTIGYSEIRKAPFYPIVRLIVAIPNQNVINLKYLDLISKYLNITKGGKTTPQLTVPMVKPLKLPLPPLGIQQKIVDEIEKFEKVIAKNKNKIDINNQIIRDLLFELYNNANKKIRLSNSDVFDLFIGKRVLNSGLSNKNTIPVYSANVFEPFGYIDKLLINNFDKPSVIWGIDGDWMVNTIDKNIQFYPTDHCGVIRLKIDNVLMEKYLAFALSKEGQEIGFSRTKRASINRISGITIPLPDYTEQQKVVFQIVELEKQISEAQTIIDNSKEQKQEILDKYLK